MKHFEAPAFVEIKMDAEIGSYQEDQDPMRDEPAFVSDQQHNECNASAA